MDVRTVLPMVLLILVAGVAVAQPPQPSDSPHLPPPPPPAATPSLGDEEEAPVPPGFFVSAGLNVVKSSYTRVDTLPAMQGSFLGQFDSFDLGRAVQPEIQFGYRFGGDFALAATYRHLHASAGKNTVTGLDFWVFTLLRFTDPTTGDFFQPNASGPRTLLAQLDEDWLDLDYLSAPRPLGETGWWMWTGGVRLGHVLNRFTAEQSFNLNQYQGRSGQLLVSEGMRATQCAANHSHLVGPHLGGSVAWDLGVPGLALFARGDTSWLLARNEQTYTLRGFGVLFRPGEVPIVIPPLTDTSSGPGLFSMLAVETGLGWFIPVGEKGGLGLALGYQVNGWWFVATGEGAAERALFQHIDRLSHGPFLRGRWDF